MDTLQKRRPKCRTRDKMRTFASGGFLRAALHCLMSPHKSCKEIPQWFTKQCYSVSLVTYFSKLYWFGKKLQWTVNWLGSPIRFWTWLALDKQSRFALLSRNILDLQLDESSELEMTMLQWTSTHSGDKKSAVQQMSLFSESIHVPSEF